MVKTAPENLPFISLGNVVENEQELESFASKISEVCEKLLAGDSSSEPYSVAATVQGVKVYRTFVQSAETDLVHTKKKLLYRAAIPVGMSPEKFYQYLISKDGYILLDPDSNPDDFDKPILGPVTLSTGGKAQLEYAHMKMPMCLSNRDFVIGNVHHDATSSFISVSVANQKLIKGASKYDAPDYKTISSVSSRIRISFFGVYKVLPDPENPEQCFLEVAQWMDINGWVGDIMSNIGGLKWYESFIPRLLKTFPVKKSNQIAATKV